MKNIVSMLICMLVSVLLADAQERQLVLRKKSSNKEQVVEEGRNIRAYQSEYHFHKGKLILLDSSVISVGEDTMSLSEIISIEVKTAGTKKTGQTLSIVGSMAILGGIAMMESYDPNDSGGGFSIDFDYLLEPIGIGFIVAGAGMTTMGIVSLVGGKNYKSKYWSYSVR